jgi:hypothetical protein
VKTSRSDKGNHPSQAQNKRQHESQAQYAGAVISSMKNKRPSLRSDQNTHIERETKTVRLE